MMWVPRGLLLHGGLEQTAQVLAAGEPSSNLPSSAPSPHVGNGPALLPQSLKLTSLRKGP